MVIDQWLDEDSTRQTTEGVKSLDRVDLGLVNNDPFVTELRYPETWLGIDL